MHSRLFRLATQASGASKPKIIESLAFGAVLATVGGFLDAYTYIGHGGIFCNAQTGNLVLLGIQAARGDWAGALAYLPPILAFVAGVFAAEGIKHNSSRLIKADWPEAVLLFEALVLGTIGFIPGNRADVWITVAASFAASVQVSSFSRLVGAPFASTMCTGNLRSAANAAYRAWTEADREAGRRAGRYSLVILSFMAGAGLGSAATLRLGRGAIWSGAGVLAAAALFLVARKPRP